METKVIAYTKTSVEEKLNCGVPEAKDLLETFEKVWIDIDGDLDPDSITALEKHFKIHPLAIEDCLDPNQRPKVELYDDFMIIILKSVEIIGDDVLTHRYNILLGENFVITITDHKARLLEIIRERIRKKKPQILKFGAEHLCYVIIDSIVDSFFPLMEDIGEAIEGMEDRAMSHPEGDILEQIHDYKRMLIIIRKVLWPQRDVLSTLYKGTLKMFKKQTRFGLRDVYDHMIQIIEILETQRDVINGVMDLYQTAISNKMNEVMKVLTVIATIFIPLTFIAGIYGMNFDRMPELGWDYGYYLTLAVMAIVAVSMLIFFKRKRWL